MRFFSFNDPSLTVSSITKQFHTNSSITTEVDHRILNALKVFPQNAVINVFKFFQFCSCRKRRWDTASRPPARSPARAAVSWEVLPWRFFYLLAQSTWLLYIAILSFFLLISYFSFCYLDFFPVILIFVLLFFPLVFTSSLGIFHFYFSLIRSYYFR